ncbi:MAG: hypothetical protein ACFFB3_22325 [Candidatus Hodarchaeota archaeon]
MRFMDNLSQFLLFGYDFEQPELRSKIIQRVFAFFLIGFLLGAIAFLLVILSIDLWIADIRDMLNEAVGGVYSPIYQMFEEYLV